MEDLDVEGAKGAAMNSALYAPHANGSVQTEAYFIVKDWRDFGAQIEKFVMPVG